MRHSIRHPSDISIEFRVERNAPEKCEALNDVSLGGLSFRSDCHLKAGTRIVIKIPLIDPPFEILTQVRWCRKREGGYYDVGVIFVDEKDAFRTRMVEQVCHIEHYKRDVLEKEGRRLTSAEAAVEWIARYAATFPSLERNEE